MTPNALSELWQQWKFNLCFAIPIRFHTEYESLVNIGTSDQLEIVATSWWQWRDHVFWMKSNTALVHA